MSHAQDRDMLLYGFFDLEYSISNEDDTSDNGSFDQHHFNLISAFDLSDTFRILGEIEWEHGLSIDDGSINGSLKLEQAWMEYAPSDALKLRAGKVLSPYGIYNEIHDATPAFLSTFLPQTVYGKEQNLLGESQFLYPKYATGILVMGTFFPGRWYWQYKFYISNGRGESPSESDDNPNKGVGGRIAVGIPDLNLDVGSSFFRDVNGKAMHTLQQSIAFDATLQLSGFQLQGELALTSLEFPEEDGVLDGRFEHVAGAYLQASYSILDQFTPFVRHGKYMPKGALRENEVSRTVAGINVAVSPRIYLKAEGHLVRSEFVKDYEMFVASIAVAF